MTAKIFIIMMYALIALLIHCIIQLLRIEVVYRHGIELIEAVGDYIKDCIDNDRVPEVRFCDLHGMERAFHDITVWKKEQMILPEKFELIKPYLKK